MSHNYVREWREFEHLTELPCLEDLVFIGNPLEEESSSNGKYNDEITKRLLYLKKLDGYPVIRNVEVAEEEEVKIQVLMQSITNRQSMFQDFEMEEDGESQGSGSVGILSFSGNLPCVLEKILEVL